MSELVNKAKQWAHEAHNSIGQKRKFSGEPYTVHTDGVEHRLFLAGEGEEVRAAGHLHDVLEDVAPLNPKFSEEEMLKIFPKEVVELVKEVTNIFTKENYPDLNRAKRKHEEHLRLSKISTKGKSIKLADITENVTGVMEQDVGFGRVFVSEKANLLKYLKDGNPLLYKDAIMAVSKERNQYE